MRRPSTGVVVGSAVALVAAAACASGPSDEERDYQAYCTVSEDGKADGDNNIVIDDRYCQTDDRDGSTFIYVYSGSSYQPRIASTYNTYKGGDKIPHSAADFIAANDVNGRTKLGIAGKGSFGTPGSFGKSFSGKSGS